jgi:hypothetical protein
LNIVILQLNKHETDLDRLVSAPQITPANV